MKVAIMQPYLFPYLGYFQLIKSADRFLILDDVSYINKGWINRNKILLQGKPYTFTFPINGASQNKNINELELVADNGWKKKIEKTIILAYRKAPFYENFFPVFRNSLYFESQYLSAFILHSFKIILEYIGLQVSIVPSTSIYGNSHLKGKERIIDLCKIEKAVYYVNPPGGESLYSQYEFQKEGLTLQFLQPTLNAYPQIGVTDFVPSLSILDLLMNASIATVNEQISNYQVKSELKSF